MGRKELNPKIEAVLARFPAIKVAILFGSAGRDRLTPRSDLDLAVAASKPLSYDERLDLQTALARSLPYEIDLVDLQAVSGTILQQALCTGTVVRKRDTLLFAALLKKMWYNQADMMPYTKMILREHCRRFVDG